MFKVDLTTREVSTPPGRHCDSGHTASETYKREGQDSPALPTRFFRVTGQGLDNVYCEPCYTIAAWYARLKKTGRLPKGDL
jgi:hypothetical protein